jgi:hypothetical protein
MVSCQLVKGYPKVTKNVSLSIRRCPRGYIGLKHLEAGDKKSKKCSPNNRKRQKLTCDMSPIAGVRGMVPKRGGVAFDLSERGREA